MKLISSSTARRRTDKAALRSFGGPQIPSPVRRIAPKPRRCTEISPPSETSPAKVAESSILFIIDLQNPSLALYDATAWVQQLHIFGLFFLMQRAKVRHQLWKLILAERILE